ncbi:BREX-1 system adenine-specific DNA-methyltransferase PglX [Bifidobacterium jacchi]|uniref:site-specific DNA-methyltransferase (adenine-specific) n=1 Tax=Bifidobacterium jacchi TaxID=2490545 RepID=A0A5N5RJI9_9BIFI|nr:BREX-1 system adenine-specific DNA-methyltransferase PglX [Bifidobacterium jacchi]KAB5607458.1 BREX-1 system adenine-specific DNA-methyltransferase PglX [Bifidobacterium jacchi]
MNTSKLQAFAAGARVELIKAVRAKLDAAMEPDSAARVDNPRAFAKLEEEIRANGGGEEGRAKTAERHAYRWFNRIIALRYMDANEFTMPHVVSGDDADNPNALPGVLSAAKRGEFDESVFGNVGAKAKVMPTIQALLDGTKTSNDPQGDAYGLLLRAYCDYWHRFMPFMFDESGAADELLLPADLLASDSVLRRAVEAMPVADCIGDDGEGTVEIIGWLYQFYIAERKTQVMAGFKKSKKAGAAEIPAATQLFTPDWIVQYLVQNTVGRLWTQNHPESRLHESWEYYIEPAKSGSTASEQGSVLRIDSPEDLTVCDPACGSGHMLTYAFDLLYDIYDEAGYSANEIPGLILQHNLFGMEIDERAANLAAFALTMKARGRYRRFFRKQVQPNIQRITPEYFTDMEVQELNDLYDVTLDADTWNTYQNADVYGSLIQPSTDLTDLAAAFSAPSDEADEDSSSWPPLMRGLSAELTGGETSLFSDPLADRAHTVLTQTAYLARKYAAVVANPPYMGSGNMGSELKEYVNERYPDGNKDLFAAFILRNLQLIKPNALLGMITMQSWMFLSSFEELRKGLLAKHSIETMAHLGAGAFDSIGGEVVSTTAFTIRNGASGGKGTYLRLVEVQGDDNQAAACAEAVDSPLRGELSAKPTEGSKSSILVTVNQHDFAQIPGSPIAYWIPASLKAIFNGQKIDALLFSDGLTKTGDNLHYLRLWWELSQREIADKNIYRFCAKGGDNRSYYGNLDYVIDWKPETRHHYRNDHVARLSPEYLWNREGITWTKISSKGGTFRLFRNGDIAETGGPSLFLKSSLPNHDLYSVLGLMTSSTAPYLLQSLNPTLNYQTGDVLRVPLPVDISKSQSEAVSSLIAASRSDWDSYETSWDFKDLEVLNGLSLSQPAADSSLVRGSRDVVLAEAIPAYIAHCKQIAEEQRQREIKNNELVADAYGVRDEVPCDVPIERVSLKRNPAFTYSKDTPAERDAKMAEDVVKEIISYAVGCMFGRYSLDKPGLILASQGETIDDYLREIPNPTFESDADNVIPVTDDEWFEDDLAARFRTFLAVALGEQHVNENIAYIEQVLGKPLRKYFATDFYDDHVKMYKNRPIYWMYSSRTDNKGTFKALVYLHRYTPATTNTVLKYLREFTGKLNAQSETLLASGKPAEVRKGEKLRTAVKECADYERDILYPLATANLPIDLDDGVLVNYLRMGAAVRKIASFEKKRPTVQSWTWPTNPLGKE